ncbi:hypothetical protein [Serratia ficaria]|uniref:hypothetical protein n=1 Tax=Serratia ficaria TaxID=61651 RepID=UPI0021827224|nr:hypothetical protein [Serratia ficaria]CAI2537520.1 Uncharacterised protein [Serratia ficaria]
MRQDGFVKNPLSTGKYDVIRATVLLSRLQDAAHRGCGLHYELFEARLKRSILALQGLMPADHFQYFLDSAKKQGVFMDDMENAIQAEAEVLREIRSNEI